MNYRSFGEQALHYFDRAHTSVPQAPVDGPAAWKGGALRDAGVSLLREFTPEEIAELGAAADAAIERGDTIEDIGRDNFPLPSLSPLARTWSAELLTGRGFVLLRGIPVREWDDEKSAIAYWGLGQHIGVPGGQNPEQHLLGHVKDTGEEASDPNVRRYKTSGDIAYHCDLADVVGLLCLRQSRGGGASRIASSVAVFNEILSRRPDLAARLFEPFLLDTRNEKGQSGPDHYPILPCQFDGERLRTFYHSDYFRSVVRHDDVPPFTEDELALLDLFEEIANSPEFYFDMYFEPGDIQLISNHYVVHSRTAYEDSGERDTSRHLLRLWLSLK